MKKYVKKRQRQIKRKIKRRAKKSFQGVLLLLVLLGALAILPQDVRQSIFPKENEKVQTKEPHGESVSSNENELMGSTLDVHFLDVGQADSTLLVCDGHAMLIDAGLDSSGTYIQFYMKKQGVESLDYLILTHPDSDHIGGAPVIITKFDIDTIFMSDYQKENRTYEKVLDALEYRSYSWEVPKAGEVYSLGSAQFTILAPVNSYDDPNNASVALRVSHGENAFLFTGDAEEKAELDILENSRRKGLKLETDVLKVGHHGSNTSTTQEFLEAVAPAYAVVSCAKDNTYGFPHREVLEKLEKRQIKVFRTDEAGEIIACSDGRNITWNTLENP